MKPTKCCLHCPGTWTLPPQKQHTCNVPTYVKGNLQLSSLTDDDPRTRNHRERVRGSPERAKLTRQNSCSERFAMAKRLHAENLEHQPLPDRVDDAVFKIMRPQAVRTDADTRQTRNRQRKLVAEHQYVPVLGCKTPTTNMDLAICWEAPLDRCYEPELPAHIDGSNGGVAPAIFTLVQRENDAGKHFKSPMERFEAKFSNIRTRCGTRRAPEVVKHHLCPLPPDTEEAVRAGEASSVDICRKLDAMHISKEHRIRTPSFVADLDRSLARRHRCECRGDPVKRARSRSVHSAPIRHQGTRYVKRNGLPAQITVPRPQTPYAKRNFCIDTLLPPFSIVPGHRDTDYPEHWRLTSVYQQSYRNPRKYA